MIPMDARLTLYIKTLRITDSSYEIFETIGSILLIFLFFSLDISLVQAIEVIVLMSLFSFYSFASNNYFDKNIDKDNPLKKTKNPYSRGEISKKEILGINGILLVLLFALGSLWFPQLLPILIVIVVNVTLYSRYFKRMPILDLVSHFIAVYSFFIFPAIVMGLPIEWLLIAALALLGISNVSELDNQKIDYETDKKSGVRSTVVAFGKRNTRIISAVSYGLIFFSILSVSFLLASIVPMLFIPLLFMHIMYSRNRHFLGKRFQMIFLGYIIFLILILSLLALNI